MPENEKYIKRISVLEGLMWTGVGLAAAAYTVAIMDSVHVWNENQWVRPTMHATAIISILGAVLAGMYRISAYNSAADNYNIHIMGLPVAAE